MQAILFCKGKYFGVTCKQPDGAQYKSSPSKLFFSMKSTTLETNWNLESGLLNILLSSLVDEFFQPPIVAKTITS
jgi:hypothetical protein